MSGAGGAGVPGDTGGGGVETGFRLAPFFLELQEEKEGGQAEDQAEDQEASVRHLEHQAQERLNAAAHGRDGVSRRTRGRRAC